MKRFQRAGAVMLGSVVAGSFAVIPAGVASAESGAGCDDLTTPVMQVVRPASQTSLVTQYTREAKGAAANFGFTDDRGVIAKVSSRKVDGRVPVWRLYKGGDFVWATEGPDARSYIDDGYVTQRVDFYAAGTNSDSCLVPMYLMRKGAVHRISAEKTVSDLLDDGWVKEQVAFWAAPSDSAATPSPTPIPTPSETPTVDPQPDPPQGPTTGDPDPTDTKFTIAVLPDTQNESNSSSDKRFRTRTDWLLANKKALDIRYAVQVGDLVNWGNVAPEQFTNMSGWMKPLEAQIPFAPVIGNHDTAAVCAGGSACPGAKTWLTVRDTTAFNKAFPESRFPGIQGTFESGKVDNAYQEFSAGGKKWMILSLELWPRKDVIQWAKQVVAEHPDDNVVVATHAYLDEGGAISGSNGGYGASSPQYLYDNLISQYPNIKMVLSGHVGRSAARTDVGVHGNKIVSLLQCYHSATDPVRLVEFDTAAGSVESRVYAPLTDTSYPDDATSTSGLEFSVG